MGPFIDGFISSLSFTNLSMCFIGAVLGTVVGVLPGLGPAATMALTLPFTLRFGPAAGIVPVRELDRVRTLPATQVREPPACER